MNAKSIAWVLGLSILLAGTTTSIRAGTSARDTVAPTVDAFVLPESVAATTIPIASLVASDNVGVTGYMITLSASPPSASSSAWQSSKPGGFTVAAPGPVTLFAWARDGAGNISATRSASSFVAPPNTTRNAAFEGSIVLGAPTASSIRINVLSPHPAGLASIRYGTTPGAYDKATDTVALATSRPMGFVLDGLSADTPYYYRLAYQTADGVSAWQSDEYSFRTARPAGAAFTFTIQADSHLDENSSLDVYRATLRNIASDTADFHIDLGDTFMCEKHTEPLTATVRMASDPATVDRRYAAEHDNFGILGHSKPLFLVNGNHEGENGYLLDGSAQNVAVWAASARQRYFLNPVPDNFYSGDPNTTPYVGRRASWYAWQWGDAHFIVLDPFWNTTGKSGSDGWAMTLGETQYRWLQETLAMSTAKYKFVFIHDLVGGLDGQMRGGIEAAPYFEWGGRDLDGTMRFASKRPGWDTPIHQLLVRYGVTAVFHGHDHLYAKQSLDGIIYQAVPQPSALNSNSGASLAASYHYTSGTILSSSGYLRVAVGPTGVKAEYVRTWLPGEQNARRKNGSVDDGWSVGAPSATSPVPGPLAAFSTSPATMSVGQAIHFIDDSLGLPTTWNWTFGDGSTSTAQFPTHAYSQAGTYLVTLKIAGVAGSSSASHAITVNPAAGTGTFNGSIVLGSPTDTSIKANIHSPGQGGNVMLTYGQVSGGHDQQTPSRRLEANVPLELVLENLRPDTRYYYRLVFQGDGAATGTQSEEYRFHTARPTGAAFTFGIQGDSHPERERTQFDPDLYRRTLQTAALDAPDFYIAMGDDFSVDTLDPATINVGQVVERYTLQRPYLGLVGRSAPLFLVNGNHEQAARCLLDGTPNNVAVWAQNARNSFYAQPAPDNFYGGNGELVPHIGLLRNYYSWTWGDALFVVIDPYWSSSVCVDAPFGGGAKRTDLWNVTHGDAQYQWLKTTLESSRAKYKFIFAHHVLGTGRGGIDMAKYGEWGGQSTNGAWLFNSKRPGWSSTLHQLMADNGVTIFFQGHDHIWARQRLDGVTYQTLSEPADPHYALYNADAYPTGDKLPNSGYTRVTVAPTGVKVDYVRTYLPADEAQGKVSGETAYSYSLP